MLVLQPLLGHESLATTGKYTDLTRADLIRAVQMNPVTGRQSLDTPALPYFWGARIWDFFWWRV